MYLDRALSDLTVCESFRFMNVFSLKQHDIFLRVFKIVIKSGLYFCRARGVPAGAPVSVSAVPCC